MLQTPHDNPLRSLLTRAIGLLDEVDIADRPWSDRFDALLDDVVNLDASSPRILKTSFRKQGYRAEIRGIALRLYRRVDGEWMPVGDARYIDGDVLGLDVFEDPKHEEGLAVASRARHDGQLDIQAARVARAEARG